MATAMNLGQLLAMSGRQPPVMPGYGGQQSGKMPFTHPVMAPYPLQGGQMPQMQGMHHPFHPGFNIGQLMMGAPRDGARFMPMPNRY